MNHSNKMSSKIRRPFSATQLDAGKDLLCEFKIFPTCSIKGQRQTTDVIRVPFLCLCILMMGHLKRGILSPRAAPVISATLA